MAPLQFLRTRIASILLSPAAQKLDFYLDNIHVDGSGLSYVALALIPTPRESQGHCDRRHPSLRGGHLRPDHQHVRLSLGQLWTRPFRKDDDPP
jgi:hypothetical protein